jgi:hypothetical protein
MQKLYLCHEGNWGSSFLYGIMEEDKIEEFVETFCKMHLVGAKEITKSKTLLVNEIRIKISYIPKNRKKQVYTRNLGFKLFILNELTDKEI